MSSFQHWINQLNLVPHPEGGFYRRNYTAARTLNGTRPLASAIYYLLPAHHCSVLHRIQSDELWHFYAGGSLLIEVITPTGELLSLKLGLDIEAGEQPQHLVPAGCWFGATVHRGEYVLAGCTVTPAFDFAEFELADRVELLKHYPQHAATIHTLTHHS